MKAIVETAKKAAKNPRIHKPTVQRAVSGNPFYGKVLRGNKIALRPWP